MTEVSDGIGVSRIGQIAMTVSDLPRAIAFYRDVLGLRFLFEAPPAMAFFDCGGVRLMLSSDNEGHDNLASMLYYLVTDIEGTQSDLETKGVSFVEKPHMIAKMPDHELWLSAFKDSEGNLLGLMEEKR